MGIDTIIIPNQSRKRTFHCNLITEQKVEISQWSLGILFQQQE
jgi:hypothetical protein